jgi:hypothetical protein
MYRSHGLNTVCTNDLPSLPTILLFRLYLLSMTLDLNL